MPKECNTILQTSVRKLTGFGICGKHLQPLNIKQDKKMTITRHFMACSWPELVTFRSGRSHKFFGVDAVEIRKGENQQWKESWLPWYVSILITPHRGKNINGNLPKKMVNILLVGIRGISTSTDEYQLLKLI